ncbi:MAG: tetratricopeptide repeat protein [Chitinivibrionales bacterium]|nr:tetratricopeptide repeat protein [Chitinivibrionales bacterium]MBD3355532.1 tetratricopeptide repeat protein [Chitinivibrionales bacterium]
MRSYMVTHGAVVVVLLACAAHADQVYDKTQKANRLYEQGKYEQALELYNETLIENPDEKRLFANKGSALYKLGKYEEAARCFEKAQSLENPNELAAVHYNKGNALFMEGKKLAVNGGQNATAKFESAAQAFIKALDKNPADEDTKWNLEVTNAIIEQLRQQEQKKSNQNDQPPPEPSEYAKKIKAQADEAVEKKAYSDAFNIMNNLLDKDQTAYAYIQYIQHLRDVVEIYN